MLIDKGLTEGSVVTIKLMNGEEILAKLVETTATGYKISKPLALSAGPKGLGMVPFLFTVDHEKDLTIDKSAVMVIVNTEQEFANQYTQGTTGIAIAG
jgi:DhnA family fructose-bisphosphate aldolase class Ia